MIMQGGSIAGWRRIGLALIGLGLALRILIAPGMMPVATPAGMTLTLCTAQGPVEYKLDIHGEQPAAKAHDPCPYGAMGAVPLLPVPAVLSTAIIAYAAAVPTLVPASERPHVAVPAPPPPARGPPPSH